MFMPDGNGQPQVAVLKVQDSEARGVLDDSEIAYIIHTRYAITSRESRIQCLTIRRAVSLINRSLMIQPPVISFQDLARQKVHE